jgi:two-component system, sensor histidine kinase FlrB
MGQQLDKQNHNDVSHSAARFIEPRSGAIVSRIDETDLAYNESLALQSKAASQVDYLISKSGAGKRKFTGNSDVLKSDGLDSKTVEDNSVESALAMFERLSADLTSSYRHLEQRVSFLKTELSEEALNSQRQVKEKEAIETRHSALLEILPAGVVLLDGKGYVSEANPAALDLLGEPLEGQLWLDVIKRSFAPKHDDGHEVSLIDGRRVRIETRSLTTGCGQLILLSDLTETRLLQEKVSRTERLGSLGKMVASLAHQIRTPLSTAMLYAGHLRKERISDDMRKECADKLLSRLTHLEHQIRDMLIFAKGETRLAEQLDMPAFFESLKSAAMPILDKHDVESEWNNASVGHILCNKETLIGACLNLITNSIEAYEPSKPGAKLRINIRAVDSDSRYACLQVCDDGPGIPHDLESKITEPFFTTKSQGTGLGLAVVQAVVKAHNGKFSIRSNSQGTVASILLPLFDPNISRFNSSYVKEVRS